MLRQEMHRMSNVTLATIMRTVNFLLLFIPELGKQRDSRTEDLQRVM